MQKNNDDEYSNRYRLIAQTLYKSPFFIITLALLIMITFFLQFKALTLTGFNFAYALDDPYIHMSIAKNLASHGHWGVTAYTLSSASSSPLWNIVLVPFYMLMGKELFVYIPFILNVIFQGLSVMVIFMFLRKMTSSNDYKIAIFSCILLLITPFYPLSIGGMEHSMQIFLSLLFFYFAVNYISFQSRVYLTYLLILAPLLVFTRYENIALVFSFSIIVAVFFKERKLAFTLLLSSLSLVIIFGLWSLFNGLGFIPSSIMAKSIIGGEGNLHLIKVLIFKFIRTVQVPHIFILYVSIVSIVIWGYFKNRQQAIVGCLLLCTFSIHITFASIGWLYRYEAYLIVLSLVYIAWFLFENEKDTKLLIVSGFMSLSMLYIYVPRSYEGFLKSTMGTKNIFEQQIQMARFLNEKCNNCKIAAGDIGAITYFTDIRLLDIAGLGSYDIIKLQKSNNYNTQTLNKLIEDEKSDLIIKYNNRYIDIEYPEYELFGYWKIRNNVVCGGERVDFYKRKNSSNRFQTMFEEYTSSSLPKSVESCVDINQRCMNE